MNSGRTLDRSQRRALETRRRLFEAALKLFLKKGFENTTVSEITEAADVAKGTFFTHFPTKEAVMCELGSMVLQAMEEALTDPSMKGAGAEERILALFESAGRWHEENREISRLGIRLLVASPGGAQTDLANQLRFVRLLDGLVLDGQQKGGFRSKVSSELAAQALAGVYYSTVLGWHLSPVRMPLCKLLAQGIGLVTKGLRA
ncbi:MAG: TetR/AcrR family transcriptional regulator [Elusimicrobiota bacterium]